MVRRRSACRSRCVRRSPPSARRRHRTRRTERSCGERKWAACPFDDLDTTVVEEQAQSLAGVTGHSELQRHAWFSRQLKPVAQPRFRPETVCFQGGLHDIPRRTAVDLILLKRAAMRVGTSARRSLLHPPRSQTRVLVCSVFGRSHHRAGGPALPAGPMFCVSLQYLHSGRFLFLDSLHALSTYSVQGHPVRLVNGR
jgi:hypothetical protein